MRVVQFLVNFSQTILGVGVLALVLFFPAHLFSQQVIPLLCETLVGLQRIFI